MKLALIGDIHGELRALQDLLKRVPPDAPVIQVGDFGIWPHKLEEWVDPGRPIMFLDGNHDAPIHLVTGEWKNAQYLPRGTVLELGDSVLLTCGGATSVDRKWRGHRFHDNRRRRLGLLRSSLAGTSQAEQDRRSLRG